MNRYLLFNILFVLATLYTNAQCTPNLTSNLLARWDFSGNASDLSGHNHNGTVVGAALAQDRCSSPNGAYNFVLNSQHINVGDAPELRLSNTDFTIAAWIYRNAGSSSGHHSIVTKRESDNQKGYTFQVSSGKLLFAVSGNNDPAVSGSSTISEGSWQHVAVTYTLSTATIRFYVNGVLDATVGPMPSPNGATTKDLHVGNDTWVETYSFEGRIDDVRMYGRALDQCSLAALAQTACSPLPVTFVDFTGTIKDRQVLLDWQTAEETNISHFLVERSEDGEHFSAVTKVMVHGQATGVNDYRSVDPFPEEGKNYYRIKTVDNDGKVQVSKTILVNSAIKLPLMLPYPNPAANVLHLQFFGDDQPKGILQIVDVQGKIVQTMTVSQGQRSIEVNVSALPKGLYQILVNGPKVSTGTFVKK